MEVGQISAIKILPWLHAIKMEFRGHASVRWTHYITDSGYT